jgi:CBS domain-containing protein
MPQTISELVRQDPVSLRSDDTLAEAAQTVLDSGLPALPVRDAHGRFAGVFGEREFMAALFPGYLDQLKGAAFLRRSLDETLERRDSCRSERVGQHMNTEHVDVGPDYADTQVAEIFLHHRVLIVPVVDNGRLTGIITRSDFFRSVAERFLAAGR